MTVNQQAQQAPAAQAAPVQNTPQLAAAQVVDPAEATAVGAYSQREYVFHEREGKGELSFEYIVNDGQANHLIWCDSYLQWVYDILFLLLQQSLAVGSCLVHEQLRVLSTTPSARLCEVAHNRTFTLQVHMLVCSVESGRGMQAY